MRSRRSCRTVNHAFRASRRGKNSRRLHSPLTFIPGDDALSLGDKPYRGRLVVYSAGGALEIVNAVKLEPYIKGVVGLEMPDRWPAAALEAQAVAARTYALARMGAVAKMGAKKKLREMEEQFAAAQGKVKLVKKLM